MKKNIFLIVCIGSPLFADDMMIEMATMMASQFAGSAANQYLTTQFDEMNQSLQSSQSDISRALSTFSSQVQTLEQKKLKQSFEILHQAENNIANVVSGQQANFTSMLKYLQSGISRQATSIDMYLQNSVSLDQLFANGRMLTPQGVFWYNLFPVGNWEYDHQSDSFWQMSCVPMGIESRNAKAALSNQNVGNNNIIFAEWYTREKSYEIEVEISIYQYQYPCFVGLIFNKARWISGDMTSFNRCRILGLYAQNKDLISGCFAQTIMTTADSGQSNFNYAWDAILNNPAKQSVPFLDIQKVFVDEKSQHTVFKIKLLVAGTSVQYKIWEKSNSEPKKYQTVTNLDSAAFLYHGIGFIAAGCLAEFKLLKPEELLFSEKSKNLFEQNMNEQISQAIVNSNAQALNSIAGQ